MQRLAGVSIALGAALTTLGAHARTESGSPNVTIYGVADAYVQSVRGDTTLHRVQSGGLSSSRFGLRGKEDLGGGWRSFFTLEAGINVDDGSSAQGGVLFGRQALVGLGNERFGELSLGRQYSSVYVATAVDFSAFGNTGTGPNTAVIGGFAGGYEPVRGASATGLPPAAGATGNGGPARVNNSVRYESPAFAGFKAGVLYGAGEVPGTTNDQRLIDLFVRYTAGAFDVIASRVADETVGATGTDATTTTLATRVSLGSGHVYAGYLHLDDGRAANEDGRGYWLGGDYRVGRHLMRAQYVVNDPRSGNDNRTQAYGVGYQFDFSRRTALYTSVTRFANQTNAGATGLGRWTAAVPAGLTRTASNDLTELAAGIRHSF